MGHKVNGEPTNAEKERLALEGQYSPEQIKRGERDFKRSQGYKLCPHKLTFGKKEFFDQHNQCDACKLWDECGEAADSEAMTIDEIIELREKNGEFILGKNVLVSTREVRFIPLSIDKKDNTLWNGIVLPKKAKHGMSAAQRRRDTPIWKTYKRDYKMPHFQNDEVKNILKTPDDFSKRFKFYDKPDIEQKETPHQNYSEILKHPKWQRKRLEIFQRDNFTCRTCQDTETTLHCHHKQYIYGNLPWEYTNDVFITLCETCHEIIEDLKKNHDILLDENTTEIFKEKNNEYFNVIDKSPKYIHYCKGDKYGVQFDGKETIQQLIQLLEKSITPNTSSENE